MEEIVFEAEIIEWRGPAPFLFAPVPGEHVGAVRYAAMTESYGWGVVPVVATVGETATVARPSRSPARYRARTAGVSGRPSICESPRECSVATTARTPARRAARRP